MLPHYQYSYEYLLPLVFLINFNYLQSNYQDLHLNPQINHLLLHAHSTRNSNEWKLFLNIFNFYLNLN